jgi:predicted nucleotide-binding protein
MAKAKNDQKQGRRNFPRHTLKEALVLPQKTYDELAGKPIKRLLLADALGISPSSTNFRDLLSSSYKYGLTEGTEKASEITLTELGTSLSQTQDASKRLNALRKAVLTPEVFKTFFQNYADRKLPSPEMMGKILVSEYRVSPEYAADCSRILNENGRFAEIIRDIGGSPHVILDAESQSSIEAEEGGEAEKENVQEEQIKITKEQTKEVTPTEQVSTPAYQEPPTTPEIPKAIFIGHSKNKTPLQKLQRILTSFQIPHKVTIDEANLGRPIPQKVKETMQQCGSAILIFTCDEKFYDEQQNLIWRPSENVVHELGAASFAYGDRIVIFKEKGLHFPTNFQSIGYIEFEVDSIEARTADLLRELIGFGLVKITPT